MLAGFDFQAAALEQRASDRQQLQEINKIFQSMRERVKRECQATSEMFRARFDRIEVILNRSYRRLYDTASPRLKKRIEAGYERELSKLEKAPKPDVAPAETTAPGETTAPTKDASDDVDFGFHEEEEEGDLFA